MDCTKTSKIYRVSIRVKVTSRAKTYLFASYDAVVRYLSGLAETIDGGPFSVKVSETEIYDY